MKAYDRVSDVALINRFHVRASRSYNQTTPNPITYSDMLPQHCGLQESYVQHAWTVWFVRPKGSMYQDLPSTLNWGYMVPNSGYLGPNRG